MRKRIITTPQASPGLPHWANRHPARRALPRWARTTSRGDGPDEANKRDADRRTKSVAYSSISCRRPPEIFQPPCNQHHRRTDGLATRATNQRPTTRARANPAENITKPPRPSHLKPAIQQDQAIALRRMMRRTLCLNARTPPKNFSSDFESESPQSIRNAIKRKVQTRSAT